ncbi:RHH-type proline utilization regulon transcriptional repressor/proline dehydrogenase/delta 1-pyrroline-5-carboxylate dehydrogenase [Curtobacterium pusillum]|uniref:L-glutamate gamma-semialdehyde dehydrogenase n=1 Tax=Curtobacterium pusillum TaxID=69373 RepID=A0AAW3T2X6_9MICO|nr:bifunctional proline dehydrogenase/L-glutamate gamma-semialdehyde dehydrogenase [Curtobacterium pusillum]MBA8989409.1 RHH-type proline utilization regulon transcriptional repressor/proline dehydrogenase/delta 1-pyrroline-5-carboxylate dehydrogenase [Curtobacterium pusillum]
MPSARLQDCTDDAVALVRRWLAASAGAKPDAGAARLADVLRDEHGLDFTRGFVDKVIRPEDPRVAAQNLEKVSHDVPEFLAWYLRGAVTLGGGFATMAPWAVVPTARRILRRMTGHLVIDATPAKLGPALAKVGGPGTRLNVNLLGEAVLGSAESDRRLQGTMDLLARDDVDYVSIKVSSVVPQMSMWAFDQTVERVVDRLVPLYRLAASAGAGGRAKFINLDMEEYRDLDVTLAVFRALLDRDEFLGLEAGIVLQAYLPDAAGALDELTDWATQRRARGGAPIKVRLVKGANLAMERVDAILHEWPLATWDSKRETDTAYLRMLDSALTPERIDAVRIGVAGHNLFDLATAWTLARRRGVTDGVDVEMLLGMASTHADAVRADVGQVLLYTPVVQPDQFDSAIAYLARRLQESASPENFIASAADIDHDESVFERERGRWLASIDALDAPVPSTHRTQDRRRPTGEPAHRDGFENVPDTDPAIAANRSWALDVLRRVPRSQLGAHTIRGAKVSDRSTLERIVARTAQAGVNWGRQDPSDRAELLDLIAHELETRRADLIEVMAAETGKTLGEADTEVSEAIDSAHHYAESARRLATLDGDGARYVPPRLTVVVPPWNFPVAIPAGGVLAALAAGSGVVLKPAPEAKRCGALLADVLWDAGVPHSLLQLVDLDENELGRDLIAHPAVDRIILTGSADTARSFRWWRAGLPLTAETSGKNAIVVTPSADLDLAVQDIVQSAFGHAGQKCSAASLVILVGSVGESERFRRQLVDATRTLRVAWPDDPTAQMGPVIAEPQGKLRAGLTELGPGESWLVQPVPLDDSGRLWSPGIRDGVRPGSDFHQTEYFGPVLGIMRAENLDQALAIQNGTDYGLTAGIHSLDADEVADWIAGVQAGNLYVNRGITGAIVRRQPFGGWKRSAVGTGTKAGGPMYVATLGRWEPLPRTVHKSIQLHGLPPRVTAVIEAARSGLSFEEFDQVRAGALSDVRAREAEFGVSHDPSGLVVQRNVLRWRPQSVIVRQAEGASTGDLVRVLVAATAARAHLLLSSARPLPGPLTQLLASSRSPLHVVDHLVESDEEFLRRAASGDVFRQEWSSGDDEPQDALEEVLSQGQDRPAHTAFGGPGARIRLIGGDPLALEEALGASVDVAIHDGPVVEAGIIEMLPFLREQSVSITAHRFGDLDPDFSELHV